MKQKFSSPDELHQFFFEEIKRIIDNRALVETHVQIWMYYIKPLPTKGCIWQTTLKELIDFFESYGLHYFIDFESKFLHAYTSTISQQRFGRL